MLPINVSPPPSMNTLREMLLLALKTALTAPENRFQEAVALAESYANWCITSGFTHSQIEDIKEEAGAWYQATDFDNSGGQR